MRDVVRVLVAIAVSVTGLCAQQAYKLPPKEVVALVDAPVPPSVSVSPTGDRVAFLTVEPNPPISMVARPFARLAGMRIDLGRGSRQRTGRVTKLHVDPLPGVEGGPFEFAAPADSTLQHVSWSPDGRRIAFSVDDQSGVQLWIADVVAGKAEAVAGLRLNDVLGVPFSWTGGDSLLVMVVPPDRGAPPKPSPVPSGPVTEETSGRVSKVATYQDLLRNADDEALFEYFATNRLVAVTLGSPPVPIGAPGMITDAEWSPDHKLILVTRITKPFSYRVPSGSFAHAIEVLGADGGLMKAIAQLPIADTTPPQGVPTGPRAVRWQPHEPATLIWTEALDEGDPLKKVPHRDRLVAWAAPFADAAREIARVKNRLVNITWLGTKGQGLMTESDRDRRWRTTSLVDVTANPMTTKVLFDLSQNDAYNNPGMPVMVTRADGDRVIRQDGSAIFMRGDGATPKGERPFLDRVDLATGEKKRLFQSAEDRRDSFVAFAGPGSDRVVVEHQSTTDPENWFVVELASGEKKALTAFADPAPELRGVKKELITYKRADGVPLSGTLYLPAGYQPGTRLPALIWAYPLEYSDAGTAGQVRGSPNRFTRLSGASPLFLLTQGYAVLMDATMPVVGDPEHMNDTFVDQIVGSAKAAIDKLDEMGVVDPKRVAVSGHSYGAFMTANLLAHCDLFAAGIARSGAYNRTLTPFGFQSERRSYWEATDLYTRMSPFTYANKINEPLLMIHGEADDNPGTHTIQSERLFQAIRGHGGTARLVLLPSEAHGYRARESILHVLAETIEWADRYVKNKKVD